MKDTVEARGLSDHTFLNPAHRFSDECEEFASKHRIEKLGYMASALVTAARLAAENDGTGIPFEQRGIAQTLEVAQYILGDLIDEADLSSRGNRHSPMRSQPGGA